jgi:hypothetical protein
LQAFALRANRRLAATGLVGAQRFVGAAGAGFARDPLVPSWSWVLVGASDDSAAERSASGSIAGGGVGQPADIIATTHQQAAYRAVPITEPTCEKLPQGSSPSPGYPEAACIVDAMLDRSRRCTHFAEGTTRGDTLARDARALTCDVATLRSR